MNLFRRIMASCFGVRFVVLFDFDGQESVRLLRYTPTGKRYARRWFPGIHDVLLADDGSCPGGVYVVRWKPAWFKKRLADTELRWTAEQPRLQRAGRGRHPSPALCSKKPPNE